MQKRRRPIFFCWTANSLPKSWFQYLILQLVVLIVYCAGGNCLPVGSCYAELDCTNPSNGPYPVPQCVGPLVCTVAEGETVGRCGIPDCNGFFCTDGSEPNEEPCPECDADLCDDAVSCWVDRVRVRVSPNQRVHNDNLKSIFGSKPPLFTVFVDESELFELFQSCLDGSTPASVVLLRRYLRYRIG